MKSSTNTSVGQKSSGIYSIPVQVFLSISLIFYGYLVYFSFLNCPQGSPLPDHPHTPWNVEMILVKLLFAIFIAAYYYSWKDRLISGVVLLVWCVAVFADSVYIGRLLHVAGDGIMFIFPIFPVAVYLIASGIRRMKKQR